MIMKVMLRPVAIGKLVEVRVGRDLKRRSGLRRETHFAKGAVLEEAL